MMVGTVALAAATIFPPGCRAKRKSSEKGMNTHHLSAAYVQQVSHYLRRARHSRKAIMSELVWEALGSASTCRKFWLAAMRASWALGLSGWDWLPRTPCTSIGICSATTCQRGGSLERLGQEERDLIQDQ